MRWRRLLGRLLLALVASALTLGAFELALRRAVGACGLTPFHTSKFPGVPHDLFPGRATTYKGVPVRINQAGFRGAELVDPPSGGERIALFGDSFTFGNGCREDETLAAALEAELQRRGRPAQVLNCGVPGYDGENVLALMRARIADLDPRRVVYFFVANDVEAPEGHRTIPADAVIDPYADFPFRLALPRWLGAHLSGPLHGLGFGRDSGWVAAIQREFREHREARIDDVLRAMRDLCAGRKAEFRVAVYPYLARASRNPFRNIEDAAGEACRKLAIPCVALVDAFDRDEDLARYWITPLDSHPNGEANRRAAALLAETMSR